MDHKNRFEDMKTGRIVVYHTPSADVQFKNGEPIPYKVIEDNGDRVILEPLYYGYGLRPKHVEEKENLRIAFHQHTVVPVPEFINFDEWQDTSWCNDETASVSFDLEDGYNLRLWVYSDDHINYHLGLYPEGHEWHNDVTKYTMCIENLEGHMTMGRHCNGDTVLQVIEEFKSNWRSLKDTEEWS